jgi:hypothetical protein
LAKIPIAHSFRARKGALKGSLGQTEIKSIYCSQQCINGYFSYVTQMLTQPLPRILGSFCEILYNKLNYENYSAMRQDSNFILNPTLYCFKTTLAPTARR